jgi:capsule biosynthesis phosphatase
VIIPCAGLGSRFKNDGFITPKPLIRCMMKPFLCWIIDKLMQSTINANVFITIIDDQNYNSHYEAIAEMYPLGTVSIIRLPKHTKGTADTIAQTIENMPILCHGLKTICMDCDNFYDIDVLSICSKYDNALLTFEDLGTKPMYSYVELKKDRPEIISRIVEKRRISSLAVCGVYSFTSAEKLLSYANILIQSDKGDSELYLSKVVQTMIDCKDIVHNCSIHKDSYVCVGTPAQLYSFYNNISVHPVNNEHPIVTPKRICFDLDSTLVGPPVVLGDYSTCQPIQKNIDLCNYLRRMNHYIIIHTARRMRTHGGNVGAVVKDIGKTTIQSLERFGIQYDELLFGKPHADVYIDDKALNANDDLQKMLGIYVESFETRAFNSIETNVLPIITKESELELINEIFWYQNIPREIKDMFPLFIGSENNNSYSIERIQGDTVSQLYIDGRFNSNTMFTILDSLKRIHISDTTYSGSCCHNFYIKKLEYRVTGYSKYKFIDKKLQMYHMFKAFFSKYSYNPTNIHGDPVFTNIIINRFEKLKFIDMRGEFGDDSSLLGDPLYDYAKVNQSIIGYDFILKGIFPNQYVIDDTKSAFDEYITTEMGHNVLLKINMITMYLIYTMLPLHDERGPEVINAYVNLLNSQHLSVSPEI